MSARRIPQQEEDPIRKKYEGIMPPAFSAISPPRRQELDRLVLPVPTEAELIRGTREFDEYDEQFPKVKIEETLECLKKLRGKRQLTTGPRTETESDYLNWRFDIEQQIAREHAEMRAFLMEKPAQTGSRVLAGVAKGAKIKTSQYAAKYKVINIELAAYSKKFKTSKTYVSLTQKRKDLAKKHKVSYRSIIRHLPHK